MCICLGIDLYFLLKCFILRILILYFFGFRFEIMVDRIFFVLFLREKDYIKNNIFFLVIIFFFVFCIRFIYISDDSIMMWYLFVCWWRCYIIFKSSVEISIIVDWNGYFCFFKW